MVARLTSLSSFAYFLLAAFGRLHFGGQKNEKYQFETDAQSVTCGL
jgi:hypothetical protein